MQTNNANATVTADTTVYPVKAKASPKRSGQAKGQAKASGGNAKASQTGAKAKASKAKAKGQGQAKASPKRTYDRFKFVSTSDRSKVAAMYARPQGATASDIDAAFSRDMPKLNLLKDAQSRGHAVGKKTVIDATTGRRVLAYRLTHADDLPKGYSVQDGPKPDRPGADDPKPQTAKASGKGKAQSKASSGNAKAKGAANA